jgi:uncharacterized protein YbjT (DUF2867 family)
MAEANGARPSGLVLVSGATGYVGGRLVATLERLGHRVRCLARRPQNLRDRVARETEVACGDVLDPASLGPAMSGVEVAYYLVHSMGSRAPFEEADRAAAENFARAAAAAGVRRIIYLGGLGDERAALSPHLRSRHEVGRILRANHREVIEFRASIVIGSGSLSFEMVRALVERVPIMVTPRWVDVPAQPIAIEDLLGYLVAALDVGVGGRSPVYEIGGADRVSYAEIMREYARQRGLRRVMIRVPVLSPRLSSLWLGLVTPLYARVGRKLIDSIRHPTVVRDDAASRVFGIRPRGLREAVAIALRQEEVSGVATRWSDALSSADVRTPARDTRFRRRRVDARSVRVSVPPAAAFAPICRIGGATGWYFADWLWSLRGWLDLLVGGAGMRRGRPDPEHLRVGDTLDCWRVEAFEPDRRLLLTAEMRLPGRAWLEFEVAADGDGSIVRQTAIFDPAGIAGLAYWYLVLPLHRVVFAGMLRSIARAARDRSDRPTDSSLAPVRSRRGTASRWRT